VRPWLRLDDARPLLDLGVSGSKRSMGLMMKRAGQSGLIDLRVIEERLALRSVERH
jgi:hypothetical protein